MTLSADIAADLATFYNVGEFAVSVVYTPIAGFKKTINGIVSANPGDEFRGADAYGQVKTVRIRSDATLGVALPVHGDAVKIGSINYEIQNAQEINDGLEWALSVSKV